MPLWRIPSPSDWQWLFRCNFTVVFNSLLRFLLKESTNRDRRNDTGRNSRGPIAPPCEQKSMRVPDTKQSTTMMEPGDWSRVDEIDKVPPADAPFDTRCGSADKFSRPTTAPRWRMSTGEATNQFICQMCRLEAHVRDRARQFATVSPKAELVISQLWHFRAKLEANTHASFLRLSPRDAFTLLLFASKR